MREADAASSAIARESSSSVKGGSPVPQTPRRILPLHLAATLSLGLLQGCAIRIVPLADERDDAAVPPAMPPWDVPAPLRPDVLGFDAATLPDLPTTRDLGLPDAGALPGDRPIPGDRGIPNDGTPPGDGGTGRGSVDLLLVIDNSPTMAAAQTALMAELGRRVVWPLTRDRAVADVRIGIVSTDLGTGDTRVPGCTARGDHAVLNPRTYGENTGRQVIPPHPEDGWCVDRIRAATQLSVGPIDFRTLSCHANLGTGGCGVEQPLEAALRALTTEAAPGGPNAGFLRPEATLAILVLSDEDDGSVRDCRYHDGIGRCDDARDVFNQASTRWGAADLNLRFYDYAPGSAQDPTWPLDRYVDPARPTRGFLGLKPGHPERIVFGAITGVPFEFQRVPGQPLRYDWDTLLGPSAPGRPDDFAARDGSRAYVAHDMRSGSVSLRPRDRDPECPNRVLPGCRDPRAVRACSAPAQNFAWPARRLVEVARRFDESPLCDGGPCRNATLSSICTLANSDFFDRFAAQILRRAARP